MFGFGLQKLIVLAMIVGAVWYGFKFFSRRGEGLEKVKKAARKAADRVTGDDAPAEPAAQEPAAQEMERCESCGDFVAQGSATSCGREACPYPG